MVHYCTGISIFEPPGIWYQILIRADLEQPVVKRLQPLSYHLFLYAEFTVIKLGVFRANGLLPDSSYKVTAVPFLGQIFAHVNKFITVNDCNGNLFEITEKNLEFLNRMSLIHFLLRLIFTCLYSFQWAPLNRCLQRFDHRGQYPCCIEFKSLNYVFSVRLLSKVMPWLLFLNILLFIFLCLWFYSQQDCELYRGGGMSYDIRL